MLVQVKAGLLSGIVRNLTTTSRNAASHYDVLGVTPKATQGEIKSAYYKLSKIHHPDTSKGDEESAQKFRALTEAYEVLGNIKLKKMYDKGLLIGRENTKRMDYQPEEEPTDPMLKFYKSRQTRNIVPTMDGRTPIYDFDAWSKNHYGELLKKNQYEREFIKKRYTKQVESAQASNQEMAMFAAIFLSVLFFYLISYGQSDYDQTLQNEANTKNETNNSTNS